MFLNYFNVLMSKIIFFKKYFLNNLVKLHDALLLEIIVF